MWVLVGEKFVCVRIAGRASLTSSIDFKTLVSELRRRGYGYFVIDLSQCSLMDSTFLGVLAGFGLKMGGVQKEGIDRAVELFNPNPRVTELLESLGVLHLFKLTQGSLEMPEATQTTVQCPTGATREELARACLEAHQTLMSLNPENASRFKDVSQFLAKDLQNLKSGAG